MRANTLIAFTLAAVSFAAAAPAEQHWPWGPPGYQPYRPVPHFPKPFYPYPFIPKPHQTSTSEPEPTDPAETSESAPSSTASETGLSSSSTQSSPSGPVPTTKTSSIPLNPFPLSPQTSTGTLSVTLTPNLPKPTVVGPKPTSSSSSFVLPKPTTTRTPSKPTTTSRAKPTTAVPTSASVPATTPKPTGGSTGGLWQPKIGSTWQIILDGTIVPGGELTPNVDIFDIDGANHQKTDIDWLHSKGKKVICYFSAGTFEDTRTDASQLKPFTGKILADWPGEKWLDVRKQGVKDVMAKRISEMAQKGCDAIDPDNVDISDNDNGITPKLTLDDSATYVRWLSDEAAKYGMSTGLKNGAQLIPKVIDKVAFSVNEECVQIGECPKFDAFPQSGKPVFNVEYTDSNISSRSLSRRTSRVFANGLEARGPKATCADRSGFSSVIKTLALNGWVRFCDGTEAITTIKDANNTGTGSGSSSKGGKGSSGKTSAPDDDSDN